jgi:hypothetical protein
VVPRILRAGDATGLHSARLGPAGWPRQPIVHSNAITIVWFRTLTMGVCFTRTRGRFGPRISGCSAHDCLAAEAAKAAAQELARSVRKAAEVELRHVMLGLGYLLLVLAFAGRRPSLLPVRL